MTRPATSSTLFPYTTLFRSSGANHTYDFRSITNTGTVTWTAGHIGGGDGSVFTNAGTFNDNNVSGYQFLGPSSFGFGGTARFVNTDTYIRNGSNPTTFTVPFNNSNNG